MKESDLNDLLTAARALVDAVSFDQNGELRGGKWMGGNGGLLSDRTHRTADALQQVLNRFEHPGRTP